MAMADIIYKPPVFAIAYLPARDALLCDRNLSPKEALMLIDCLNMRQQDRSFREEMRERAKNDQAAAEIKEKQYIDYCNDSWMPNAVLFRMFTPGDMFATQRDFDARDARNVFALELTRRRNIEVRDHNAAVTSEEKRMHDLLQGCGAQAKRLFNTIAISGMTSHHFEYDEFAAALRFPNPLERMLP